MKYSLVMMIAVTSVLLLESASAEAHHRNVWRGGHWGPAFEHRWDRGRWVHRNQRRAFRSGFRAGRWNRGWNRGWGWRHDPWAFGVGGIATGIAIGTQLDRDCDRRPTRSRERERDWDGRRDRPDQIDGCFRIEVLPDGRERRIELPRSACR